MRLVPPHILLLYILIKILNLLIDDILEGLGVSLLGCGVDLENHIENSIVYNF